VTNEWFLLAETEVMELVQARRAGRVHLGLLRRLSAQLHVLAGEHPQSIGRFYEVQTYGPDNQPNLTAPPPPPAGNGTA